MRKLLLLSAVIVVTSFASRSLFAQAGPTASSPFKLVNVPNIRQFPFHSDLSAVSASSANDIWAVGESGVHFDGTKWTAVALPLIKGDLTSGLTGIVDVAPNNVWAVGNINIHEDNPNQVIEHYDGTAWSVATGPTFQPTDQPFLNGLAATSSSDIWATGSILTLIGGTHFAFPLFEHFDGKAWTATIDENHDNAFMFGVSAIASNDVWAVGDTGALGLTFAEHFDGTSWSAVPTPSPGNGENVLLGVAAISSNNVWAVGFYVQDFAQDRPQKTLVEHWDGTAWSVVPSPNVGGNNSTTLSNELRGVVAVSANDVWAFGDTDAFGPEKLSNLAMHWNGTAWSIVSTPQPNPRKLQVIDDVVAGGTVIPQGNLWLVGTADGFGAMVLNATGQ